MRRAYVLIGPFILNFILVACGGAGTTLPAQVTAAIDPTPTSEPSPPVPDETDLMAYPVMPVVSDRAREIYRAGQAAGRNPDTFSKIGDCITASENFFIPFSAGAYDLGEYAALQETIDRFGEVVIREVDGQPLDSFSNTSIAAGSGFTSAGALDPTWANPAWCQSGESPLACEYRVTNPALALIMFGTNDVTFISIDRYESYLRDIVQQTIDAGIIPVLSTFPPRPDKPEEADAFNQIIVRIAVEYDIPMVNLWRALQDLPDQGVQAEHVTKLTVPDDGCMVCFTGEHLETGIVRHNLVMLQALHEVTGALSE